MRSGAAFLFQEEGKEKKREDGARAVNRKGGGKNLLSSPLRSTGGAKDRREKKKEDDRPRCIMGKGGKKKKRGEKGKGRLRWRAFCAGSCGAGPVEGGKNKERGRDTERIALMPAKRGNGKGKKKGKGRRNLLGSRRGCVLQIRENSDDTGKEGEKTHLEPKKEKGKKKKEEKKRGALRLETTYPSSPAVQEARRGKKRRKKKKDEAPVAFPRGQKERKGEGAHAVMGCLSDRWGEHVRECRGRLEKKEKERCPENRQGEGVGKKGGKEMPIPARWPSIFLV